jgi:hypothetical protein
VKESASFLKKSRVVGYFNFTFELIDGRRRPSNTLLRACSTIGLIPAFAGNETSALGVLLKSGILDSFLKCRIRAVVGRLRNSLVGHDENQWYLYVGVVSEVIEELCGGHVRHMVAEERNNFDDEKLHAGRKLRVKFVGADKAALDGDRQNITRVVLELAEAMTKLRTAREFFETRVMGAVVCVHGLVHEDGEVKANEKAWATRSRDALKAMAIVAPTVAEVRGEPLPIKTAKSERNV